MNGCCQSWLSDSDREWLLQLVSHWLHEFEMPARQRSTARWGNGSCWNDFLQKLGSLALLPIPPSWGGMCPWHGVQGHADYAQGWRGTPHFSLPAHMSPGCSACSLQLLQLWSGGALPTEPCPITGLCWKATGLVGSSEGAALVLLTEAAAASPGSTGAAESPVRVPGMGGRSLDIKSSVEVPCFL